MPQSLGFVSRFLALAAFTVAPYVIGAQFSSGAAGYSVSVGAVRSGYNTFSFFLLPEESTTVEAGNGPEEGESYELDGQGGEQATRLAGNRWVWKAPMKPGLYPLTVTQNGSGERVTLNIFVLVPHTEVKSGVLNGYRIGHYPTAKPGYDLPRGFIEVTKANEETLLSPHFRIKQFLCKQGGGYPKYIVLQEKLIQKLELTLTAVNERGHDIDSFHIMSGYRTPQYNRSIGNVKYSRHQWGDAADILLDKIPAAHAQRKNWAMDSARFTQIVDEVPSHQNSGELVGGVGKYKANKAHGVFVHVDVRGHGARWGH